MGASPLTACLYFDRAHLEINRHSFRASGITICLYYPRSNQRASRERFSPSLSPRNLPSSWILLVPLSLSLSLLLSYSLSLSPSFVPRGLTKVLLGGYLEAPFYPRPGRFTLPRIKISARPRREILPTVSPLEARTGIVCTRRNGRAGTRGYTHRNGRLRLACMIRRVRARAKRRRSMNVPHYSLPEDVPRGNWRTCGESFVVSGEDGRVRLYGDRCWMLPRFSRYVWVTRRD